MGERAKRVLIGGGVMAAALLLFAFRVQLVRWEAPHTAEWWRTHRELMAWVYLVGGTASVLAVLFGPSKRLPASARAGGILAGGAMAICHRLCAEWGARWWEFYAAHPERVVWTVIMPAALFGLVGAVIAASGVMGLIPEEDEHPKPSE